MIIAHRFIGIDICKAHLDIYDDGADKSQRIANSAAAIAAMLARWPRADLRVIVEATGSYDRTLRCALEAANIAGCLAPQEVIFELGLAEKYRGRVEIGA